MKIIPYVEILIDRWSSSAPFRATSEWIRAYARELRVEETGGEAHALDDNST
jgi:hypothetical protein